MPSTVFDSAIYRDFFGTPAMRAIWGDEAMVARYVEVEIALAQAEAVVQAHIAAHADLMAVAPAERAAAHAG